MNEDLTPDRIEARLKAMNARVPVEADFAEKVMARIRVDAGSPRGQKDYRLWRWVMKGTIGIAASVAVAATVWHVSVGSPRTVYGMENLPQRLLSLKSLHMKGTIYRQDGTGQPLELWAQRPGMLRINGRLGEGPTESTSTNQIITPAGNTMIDPENKRVAIATERPVDAELETEQCLQQALQMLIGQAQPGVPKVRDEQVGSVKAAVYENRTDSPNATVRTEVAINPDTGLPLRSVMFMRIQGTPERKCMEMDLIEANGAIAPETFVFHPPADYQVVNAESAPTMLTSQANDARCATRYIIALNSHDTLMCWARYSAKNPAGDLEFPGKGESVKITDESGKACEEHLLHADEAQEGFHWRWSLVRATTDKEFGRMLTTTLNAHGSTTAGSLMPVQLPTEELEKVVEEAQRVTLEEGKAPMSVKEIEAAVK